MDKKIIQDRVDEINEIIYGYLPEEDGPQAELADAMEYAVEAGGKRLRPMLMQETFRLFAGGKEEPEILHAFMAAIEFIHTYSLIHDDLPSLDNADLRRGLPTLHVKYGEAAALLVGDALLNYAYETIFDSIEGSEEPDDYMGGISAARVLAEKSGVWGMVGGQYVDVYSEKHPDFVIDEEILRYIHKNKTAALIEAAMVTGAILGSASDIEIQVIEKMAEYLGIAFQIRDDILDVKGNKELLGKPVGSDKINEKVTFVTLYGMDKAEELVKEYTDNAMKIYNSLRFKNNFLKELIILLVDRDK